jgi:translation initiation factor 2 subunit 1
MIINKELPSDGEFVLIKISKIMPYGAYCSLTEYNIDAYLPISEISSGWIKNIHEFIKEGQQDVAKVIFVDKEKKSVDISLKKINPNEKKEKINEYRLEKRAEGLFNQAIIATKNSDKRTEIISKLSTNAQTYTEVINNSYSNKNSLSSLLGEPFSKILHEIVVKNTKPKVCKVSYIVDMKTTDTKSGISTLKNIFSDIESLGVKVLYLGAPKYRLVAEDSTYPNAEAKIKKAQKIFEKNSKKITFSIAAMKPE